MNRRFVSLAAVALLLVAGVPVVFDGGRAAADHDGSWHVTELVSVSSSGTRGDSGSHHSSISGDARFVAFDSFASNLVDGDANHADDVFVEESSASRSSTTTTIAGGDGSLPSVAWLATGDSYSSGEGLADAIEDCQRSLSAYVPQTRDRLTGAGWVIDPSPFVPCTGYLVGNLYNETSEDVVGRVKGSAGDGSLYARSGLAADAQLDLITFSFGGNDIAFSQVIRDCLGADKDWIPGVAGDRRCDITEAQLVKRVTDLTNGDADFGYLSRFLIDERGSGSDDDVYGSLADFYAYVYDRHLAAGNGHLVVVGYPRIFSDSRSWSAWTGKRCWGFHKDDADMLGRVAEDLDDTISDQVDVAAVGRNIHYLSVIDEFEDHELCGSEEDWVNSLYDIWHGEGRRPQRAFHPKEAGHDAETDLLEAFLKQLDWDATTSGASPTTTLPTTTSTTLPTATLPELTEITPIEVTASSQIAAGFAASRVIDGDLETEWHVDHGADPLTLEFRFAQRVQIRYVEIYNIADQDRFLSNYQIKDYKITVDDLPGVEYRNSLMDLPGGPQRVDVASVETTTLTLQVLSSYPSQAIGTNPAFTELVVAEVRFWGTPSGTSTTLAVRLVDQYGQPVQRLVETDSVLWSYMPSMYLLDVLGERLPGTFVDGVGHGSSLDGVWAFSESLLAGEYRLVFEGGECCQSSGGPSRTWAGFESNLEVGGARGWDTTFEVVTTDTRLPVQIVADLVNAVGTPIGLLEWFELLDPDGDPVRLDMFARAGAFYNSSLNFRTPDLPAGDYTLRIAGTDYAVIEVPIEIPDIRYMSTVAASDARLIDLGTITLRK